MGVNLGIKTKDNLKGKAVIMPEQIYQRLLFNHVMGVIHRPTTFMYLSKAQTDIPTQTDPHIKMYKISQ